MIDHLPQQDGMLVMSGSFTNSCCLHFVAFQIIVLLEPSFKHVWPLFGGHQAVNQSPARDNRHPRGAEGEIQGSTPTTARHENNQGQGARLGLGLLLFLRAAPAADMILLNPGRCDININIVTEVFKISI